MESDLSWRMPLFIQCVIGFILAAGTLVIPESPRWLIDTDKEEEGLRVIADLHGGNPNHPTALAEFQEIKEKVLEDVSDSLWSLPWSSDDEYSGTPESQGPIQ